MRGTGIFVGIFASLAGACDGEVEGLAPDPTLAKFVLPFGGGVEDDVCFALEVKDAAGEVWLSRGSPTGRAWTREDVVAEGALCTTKLNDEPITLTTRCPAGRGHVARAWLLGIFDARGKRDHDLIVAPDPEGSAVAFDCAPHGETVVEGFRFLATHRSRVGFLDVSVSAKVPEGMNEICYAVRVENSAPRDRVVSSQGKLCTTSYGIGAEQFYYALFCDATEGVEHGKIRLWIESARWDDEVPRAERVYHNPCPVPSGGTVSTWGGGCLLPVTCLENSENAAHYDLDLTLH